MMIDVVAVTPRPNFVLELEYANGENRHFDATSLLIQKPWTALATWTLFRRARVQIGTVAWPGDLDIAPETLYDCSIPIDRKNEEFAKTL